MTKERIHGAAMIVMLTLCAAAAMKISGSVPHSRHSFQEPGITMPLTGPLMSVRTATVEITPDCAPVSGASARAGRQNCSSEEAVGLIARADGIIAAPRQILGSAATAHVRLRDGREYVGRVFADSSNPFALVKIPASGLQACDFAPIDTPELRTRSLRMRFGAVRWATGGSCPVVWPSMSMNQRPRLTDRTPGAPVLDYGGRVVAVNLVPAGGSMSWPTGRVIGGLTAAEAIQRMLDETAEKSPPRRRAAAMTAAVKLGIQVTPTTPALLAQSTQSRGAGGAIVAAVFPSSPAERGGLRVGDLLVEIGGKTVRSAEDVAPVIRRLEPDEDAGIVVERFGRRVLLPVIAGE